jgi:hypothetical protein
LRLRVQGGGRARDELAGMLSSHLSSGAGSARVAVLPCIALLLTLRYLCCRHSHLGVGSSPSLEGSEDTSESVSSPSSRLLSALVDPNLDSVHQTLSRLPSCPSFDRSTDSTRTTRPTTSRSSVHPHPRPTGRRAPWTDESVCPVLLDSLGVSPPLSSYPDLPTTLEGRRL